MSDFFKPQTKSVNLDVNKRLLQELEKIASSIGMEDLTITSGRRGGESTDRIYKNRLKKYELEKYRNEPYFDLIEKALKRIDDKGNIVYSKNSGGRAAFNRDLKEFVKDKSTYNDIVKKVKKVRADFGGYESPHLRGTKVDTSRKALRARYGKEKGDEFYEKLKQALVKSGKFNIIDEKNISQGVLDIQLKDDVLKEKPYKDYGEQFGPSDEELMQRPLKEETSYSDLPFKEAFEKAMKDKGEGEVFKYKGKPILLKRAEPEVLEPVEEKEQTPPKSLADMLAPYAEKMDDVVKEETYKEPAPEAAEPEVLESVEKVEPISEFDPRELQLQRLDSLRESYMPRKEDMFEDGGMKKEEKEVYGPSLEELQGRLDMLRNPQADDMPSQEDMNFVPEEESAIKPVSKVGTRSADFEGNVEASEQADMDYEAAEIEQPIMDIPEPKEEKPSLTMDELEKRYMDLMKASADERKTAQWATAATQIASMLDKYSNNPVGIQPINFEAQVNPVQMKELLTLGRMKGLGQEDRMTAYQQATLEERRKARELAEKKLDAAMAKAPEESLTEAQKSLDRTYGKEYAEYIAAGGSKTVESDLGKLADIAKEMEQNKDMFTGPLDKAVEYTGGFDTVRAAVNPRLQDIKSRLEQIIQQDLRTTLGAQFTEKEGKQFLERSFDPKLGYEANKKRLDDFIKMVKSRAEARKKAARYFEDKGTLKGYKGTEVGASESKTVLLEAPNGQRKRVRRESVQKYLDRGAKVIEE